MKRSLKEVRKGLECGSCCPHRAWVVSPASSSLNPSFRVFMELLLHQSVQSLSLVWLSATPWTAARRASLSITNSWSLLKLVSIESVMPSSHLILCRPLLLPPIPPSIRVAGASRQSRSGPENVHDAAKKKYNSKDGVERIRHVSTKGRSLKTTLFSIQYLYRRA